MSIYKLVTIDQRFIAETIARTGSEQLLNKVARSFVGLYSQDENWYIPLRANLGKKKPEGSYFETPFKASNSHFKRPGLDFEKSIFVPVEYTIEIRNTLPSEQSELIFSKQEEIRQTFEEYVLGIERLDKNSPSYKFSTVPLFPEGVKKIIEIQEEKKEPENNKQETLFDDMIDVLPEKQNDKTDKTRISPLKSDSNMYWYALDIRPVSIGTHPNKNDNPATVDVTFINTKGLKYGAVGYEQALSESEIINYDLNFIGMAETALKAKDVVSGSIMSELEVGQILCQTMKTSEHKINKVARITSIDDHGVRIEWVEQMDGKGNYLRNDKSNSEVYPKELIESEWRIGRKTHEKIFNKAINREQKKSDLQSGGTNISEKLPTEKGERTIQDIIKQKDYKALSSHLKNGISSYLETDTFKNYLNFVSKFHKYSEKNVRLLLAQNPEIKHVAAYKKWKDIGRTVIRNPKTLYVYAPGYKIMKDKNGKPVKDENGQVVKEKFFFLTPVFDVSQTNGDPIPKPIHDLEGDFETPEQFVKVYKAIENISPVPVKIEPIEGSARGYYHKLNKEIVLKNGLGEMMTLKTLIHEVTHAKLHADSTCVFGDTKYSQQEFEAESVAYIVSNHLGIDTSDYSFGYLASWTKQGQSVDSFTESLDRITKEAQQLIESLDKSLSLSFAMAEPANKFEERVAKAQGRDIQPTLSETKSAVKEIEPVVPKEERPRLNP